MRQSPTRGNAVREALLFRWLLFISFVLFEFFLVRYGVEESLRERTQHVVSLYVLARVGVAQFNPSEEYLLAHALQVKPAQLLAGQLAAALDTPVMRMLDEFSGEIERFRALFLLRGAEFAFRRLEELKCERNLMTFDDMPRLVRDALDLPDSPLAGQLRQKFSAGIIDEFQDTDPVQYRIFQKLFVETEPQKTLFLVGDPRQAIYFFRGGDLATYLRARADVEPGRVYSLDTNYRSSPGMIRAVNRLFGREHNAPFAVPPELLTLPEIHAPGDEEAKTIESPSPLRIYRDPELHAESWPKYCAELAVRMLNAPEAIIPATEDGSPPPKTPPRRPRGSGAEPV